MQVRLCFEVELFSLDRGFLLVVGQAPGGGAEALLSEDLGSSPFVYSYNGYLPCSPLL